jgi:hypothetical protein
MSKQTVPCRQRLRCVKLIESPNPPAHLLLGPDAFKYVSKFQDELKAEFSAWEDVTRSTNFD